MATSTAKLREELLALAGVDIMIDDNTFKSTYDIMDELSQKWGDLTDIQKATITEMIAGLRQGNVVSSLMENFDIARKALETSQSSQGSATKEHEKWLESLEAKLKQLEAAWQGLSEAFLKDKSLGKLIDTGTIFLNILNGIIDTLGLIPSAIASTGIILFVKNFG